MACSAEGSPALRQLACRGQPFVPASKTRGPGRRPTLHHKLDRSQGGAWQRYKLDFALCASVLLVAS